MMRAGVLQYKPITWAQLANKADGDLVQQLTRDISAKRRARLDRNSIEHQVGMVEDIRPVSLGERTTRQAVAQYEHARPAPPKLFKRRRGVLLKPVKRRAIILGPVVPVQSGHDDCCSLTVRTTAVQATFSRNH